MKGGPLNQAIREIRSLQSLGQDADVDRIARRYGVDSRHIKQRLGRAITFSRSIERRAAVPDLPGESINRALVTNEKHHIWLWFRINGILVKFNKRDFYRGELIPLTRRGSEQCKCGRDVIAHSVPVVSNDRPQILCECGVSFDAEERP